MRKKFFAFFFLVVLCVGLVSSFFVFYVSGSVIFQDGFETGFGAWSSTYGTPYVNSTEHIFGSYSMRCDASGDYVKKSFALQSEVWVVVYYRLDVVPPANGYNSICQLEGDSSTQIWRLIVRSDSGGNRFFRFYMNYGFGSGYNVDNSTIELDADSWYKFEFQFVCDDTVGEYNVWVNGSLTFSETGVDTSGTAGADELRVGTYNRSYNCYAFYDGVVVSDVQYDEGGDEESPYGSSDLLWGCTIQDWAGWNHPSMEMSDIDRLVSLNVTCVYLFMDWQMWELGEVWTGVPATYPYNDTLVEYMTFMVDYMQSQGLFVVLNMNTNMTYSTGFESDGSKATMLADAGMRGDWIDWGDDMIDVLAPDGIVPLNEPVTVDGYIAYTEACFMAYYDDFLVPAITSFRAEDADISIMVHSCHFSYPYYFAYYSCDDVLDDDNIFVDWHRYCMASADLGGGLFKTAVQYYEAAGYSTGKDYMFAACDSLLSGLNKSRVIVGETGVWNMKSPYSVSDPSDQYGSWWSYYMGDFYEYCETNLLGCVQHTYFGYKYELFYESSFSTLTPYGVVWAAGIPELIYENPEDIPEPTPTPTATPTPTPTPTATPIPTPTPSSSPFVPSPSPYYVSPDVVWGQDYDFVSSSVFEVQILVGSSLIFQLHTVFDDDVGYPYVALYANGSDFNATSCSLEYSDNTGGVFTFTASCDTNLTFGFNYPELGVTLLGGAGNLVDSETVPISNGGSYKLVWSGFDIIIMAANINVGVTAAIILIVLFAPAVALVLLGVGKWGFVMGMTVGAVLGYLMLPLIGITFEVWILFAVLIVDAGVFIASWKSGG